VRAIRNEVVQAVHYGRWRRALDGPKLQVGKSKSGKASDMFKSDAAD
jgi:hypothetical protein